MAARLPVIKFGEYLVQCMDFKNSLQIYATYGM